MKGRWPFCPVCSDTHVVLLTPAERQTAVPRGVSVRGCPACDRRDPQWARRFWAHYRGGRYEQWARAHLELVGAAWATTEPAEWQQLALFGHSST